MSDTWHVQIDLDLRHAGGVSAVYYVPGNSPWFEGHFPGEAILPGIAQLAMVLEVINTVDARPSTVSRISRVRFKRIIRPGDRLNILVAPRANQQRSFSFRIEVGQEVACSGVLTVGPPISGNPDRMENV